MVFLLPKLLALPANLPQEQCLDVVTGHIGPKPFIS